MLVPKELENTKAKTAVTRAKKEKTEAAALKAAQATLAEQTAKNFDLQSLSTDASDLTVKRKASAAGREADTRCR